MILAELRLSQITLDPRCQSRVEFMEDYAEELAEHLRAGGQLPPGVAFRMWPGAPYILADGHHTRRAHELAGRKTMQVNVKVGDIRDAILYAAGCNARHGKRPTPADVRRAVLILLEDDEWGQWSASEIARRVGCGRSTVGRLKEALSCEVDGMEENGTVKARRGGTTYRMTPFRGMAPDQQRAAVEAATEDCRPAWRTASRDGLEQAERNLAAEGEAVATVLPHVHEALTELRRIEKAEAEAKKRARAQARA